MPQTRRRTGTGAAQRYGGKNIVVCLDGTNNRIRAESNTNVVRLHHLLALDDPTKQVAYYGPGLGTFSAAGAWSPPAQALSRALGLAFGAGIRPALGSAYSFVMSVYQPGDRIYVFGFSRGAYTARALCGLLEVFGVFRQGADTVVPYAIRAYTAMKHFTGNYDKDKLSPAQKAFEAQHWKALDAFEDFGVRRRVPNPDRAGGYSMEYKHVPVHFAGLWDTVNAVGTRFRTIGWPYTATLPHAATVRSAIALDEWRWRYRPVFVRASHGHPYQATPDIQQVWFAGVHSDVGGRYPTGARLSDIPLAWMIEEAMVERSASQPAATAGRPGTRSEPPDQRRQTHQPHLERSHRDATQALPDLALPRMATPAADPGAHVHASVRERLKDPRYANLVKQCEFVDDNWMSRDWVPRPPQTPDPHNGPEQHTSP